MTGLTFAHPLLLATSWSIVVTAPRTEDIRTILPRYVDAADIPSPNHNLYVSIHRVLSTLELSCEQTVSYSESLYVSDVTYHSITIYLKVNVSPKESAKRAAVTLLTPSMSL